MTHDFGGMPFPPEMDSFQTEIGSNQGLVTGGDLQDGAIISDAGCNPSSSGCPIPDARDQEFFGQRQGGINDIQTMNLEQAKSGAECPVLGGNPCWLSPSNRRPRLGSRASQALLQRCLRPNRSFISLGVWQLVTRRSVTCSSAFRNIGLCAGSLTGRIYFGTVAKLLPKALAELSAACG